MREIRTSGLTRGEALSLPYSTVFRHLSSLPHSHYADLTLRGALHRISRHPKPSVFLLHLNDSSGKESS